ncbi:MAG: hypothetical protein IKM59_03170 [Oscillospiraceae bacterium]|nr:hypothetical protein [Oscillospiraceae bacterium]
MTPSSPFCNITIVKKQLSRLWITALVAFLFLMTDALRLFPVMAQTYPIARNIEDFIYQLYFSSDGIMEFLFSILFAAFTFSYLHKKKDSSFYHSLPLSRDCLFCSHFVSGLLLYALPWAAVTAVFTPVIGLLYKGYPILWNSYLQSMVYRLTLYFVGYSINALAMVLCGRTFFAILTAFVLHFLFPLALTAFRDAVAPLLYGVPLSENTDVGLLLSPFFLLANMFDAIPLYIPWVAMGFCTALALLVCRFTARLHRKRQEEQVGTSLVFPPVLAVLQYILTFFGSYLLLVIVAALTGMWVFMFPTFVIVLFGIFAFFPVRMLLLRSRKVFQKKAFLGCAIYVLVFSAVLFAFRVDLFGIVRRVPEPEKVQEICFYIGDIRYNTGTDYVTADPQEIRELEGIHKQILRNREAFEAHSCDVSCFSYESYDILRLTYTLTNGKTIERVYRIYPNHDFRASAELFAEIESFFLREDRYKEQLRQLQERAERTEYWTESTGNIVLSTRETQELFQAIALDIEEGTMKPLFVNYRGGDLHICIDDYYKDEDPSIYPVSYIMDSAPKIPLEARHTNALLEQVVEAFTKSGIIY